MDRATRLKRLKFRAWHRGTKEADYMMGGFYDRFSAEWSDAELDWFEALIEEQDVDIMGWAIGSIPVPDAWRGPMIERMQALDYVVIPR